METLSKIYLELANVIPETTRSRRDIEFRVAIVKALQHLDYATPRQRNGPCYQAIGVLRGAIGLAPMEIGGKATDGLPK